MTEEFKLPMDGTYMNVIRFGTGEKKLVIISGISLCGLEGQGDSVADAYSMFSDCYTVCLFDRKKLIPQGYTVGDMAEDIYRALKELDIHSADFYGVSQGGMIALYLAIAHPEFVSKMVLCSTLCRTNDIMDRVSRLWQRLAAENDVVSLNRSFFELVYSPAYLERFRDILPVLEKQGTASDCERFAILAKACSEFDVYDLMDRISCPVLVLGDEGDRATGAEGSHEIAERLNCDIYMYSGYSHAVYDEAPDIKQKILGFFNSFRT